MVSPALSFRHVTKLFKSTPALNDVSFEVESGECFALAGVNGAGKTTLIKCLLDLAAIDDGHIEILGVPHTQTRSRAPLAYLPERFSPPYYLSGEEFLRYIAALSGVRPAPTQLRDLMRALELEFDALSKPPRELSKGMTQKLGIASCLLTGKQVYILDEPLSGLDPRARALVKGQLQKLKSQGKTLFFTSHVLADVQELCDRLTVLHEGGLRFIGSVKAFMHGYGASDLEQAFLCCVG